MVSVPFSRYFNVRTRGTSLRNPPSPRKGEGFVELWKLKKGTTMIDRATGNQISILKFFRPRNKAWSVYYEWTTGPNRFNEETKSYPNFRDQFCLPKQEGTDA
jgi:hypothetical protein